jgi:flagellar biosynthesis/type III secretory pathway chaperone
MVELWAELQEILGVESELYRRLLEVLSRERTALLRSRPVEIEACTAEKSDLIGRLSAAERRRAEVVNRLALHMGRPAAEVTLSLLAQSAPEPQSDQLRRARSQLIGLMARIREENRRSEDLCRHIGELLRAAYGVVKGLAANGFVYQRGGRLERARLHGKLVCDEI